MTQTVVLFTSYRHALHLICICQRISWKADAANGVGTAPEDHSQLLQSLAGWLPHLQVC